MMINPRNYQRALEYTPLVYSTYLIQGRESEDLGQKAVEEFKDVDGEKSINIFAPQEPQCFLYSVFVCFCFFGLTLTKM